MPRTTFWKAFAMGAAAGTGAMLVPQLVGRGRLSRIIRLEKSIQVGRPVEEVYAAWTDWDRLPRATENIAEIRHEGDRTHWRIQVEGQHIEWDATIEQRIPNQAIGWKSISGPKHTGRVTFSPLGDGTLVLVTMNYAPPFRVLRALLAPFSGDIEGMIEKVLREFKASVEGHPKGVQGVSRSSTELPKTGTFGGEPRFSGDPVGFNTEIKR